MNKHFSWLNTTFRPVFMKRLRILFINFFGFSKIEANASIAIVFFLLSAAIFPRMILGHMKKEPEIASDSTINRLLDSLILAPKVHEEEFPFAYKRFPFDPNTTTQDEFISLGFKPYLANRIIKYREAGGNFKTPEDLLKIYGMDTGFFVSIANWIQIEPQKKLPDNPIPEITKVESPIANTPAILDLNNATSEDLQKVNGIGPVFSRRIISYRELLGGFYSTDQLNEVYGLKGQSLQNLKSSSSILPNSWTPINVNSDSVQFLARHPYISWNLAKAIVHYKKQHGKYEDINDIRQIKILSDTLYQKISPYLSLEP